MSKKTLCTILEIGERFVDWEFDSVVSILDTKMYICDH